MENVNLKDAQQGTSTEKKQGKTEYRILTEITRYVEQTRIGDSDDFSTECSVWVRFYKNARGDDTCRYRVVGSSTVDRLMAEELKSRDLVEVRFSEDGKEVVGMEKLGHLYFDGELDK